LGHLASRVSRIRGIRSNYDFATSAAVVPLCTGTSRSSYLEIVRAYNARLIMSNVLPDGLEEANKQPYCICHPDLATEETYRQVATRHPAMSYQIGRACAVAGHARLYAELDIFPEASIAGEARESETEGGLEIYKAIMASPKECAIMNDYVRSINIVNYRSPAFLNADTCVCKYLVNFRSELSPELLKGRHWDVWDIEEDLHVGEKNPRVANKGDEGHSDPLEVIEMLCNPLPLDLPTLSKDL
jgi:hypothetical protein